MLINNILAIKLSYLEIFFGFILALLLLLFFIPAETTKIYIKSHGLFFNIIKNEFLRTTWYHSDFYQIINILKDHSLNTDFLKLKT